MSSHHHKTAKRETFTSGLGFIMACVGSAVGMGNIWRFPTFISAWGGMTFLIPYFLFVILIGSSGVIGEMALGRAGHGGPVKSFGVCTEKRWGNPSIGQAVGMIPVLGSLALAIGYSCVMGWIFKYAFLAFSGGLMAMGTDIETIGGVFGATASAHGATLWVILAVSVSCLIMIFGVADGIEKANKIMMPVLFFLFVGLGLYIMTLDGAVNGYKYILGINPAGFKDPRLWIFAFGQAFFSLSVAGNGTVIYGSYLKKEEDIPRSAAIVAFFDTVAALLASFVIIPAMAVGGAALTEGGPGLMFIYLVQIMNGMKGGRIIEIVFYICILFAGCSSIINMYDVAPAFLQDSFGVRRKPAAVIIHVFGGLTAIFIQAIVSQWMDVVSIYICPLGALLAGIMFFWIAGKQFVLESVSQGREQPVGGWFYPLGRYIYCAAALIALIAGAVLGGIG